MSKKIYKDIYVIIGTGCVTLEGSPDDIIAEMERIKKKYSEYTSLYIDVYNEDGYTTIELSGNRPETDKERDKRLADAQRVRQKREEEAKKKEAKEKELYQRLKEKYETD